MGNMTEVGNSPAPVNRLLRVCGQDTPATQVVMRAIERLNGIVQLTPVVESSPDYVQIDRALHVEFAQNGEPIPPVAAGIGYAGLTPLQRGRFLQWAAEPTSAAPPAFQQLYLAHLEVGLLEGRAKTPELLRELRRLGRSAVWQGH